MCSLSGLTWTVSPTNPNSDNTENLAEAGHMGLVSFSHQSGFLLGGGLFS